MSLGTWYATLGIKTDQFVLGIEQARTSLGRVGTGSLLAGGAIAYGLKQAFDSAARLNETMNAAQVVFQSNTASVEKFGDSAARAFGESKQQAIQAALVFGNLFRTAGLSSSAAAQQAIELTKRAADIASVYNVEIQRVLDSLRSGITGQARPLRQYGILINEARVSAEALRETGKRSKLELTEGERVQARYNLIMKDSAITQGDFANTANQAANQLRIAHAEIENARASIGQGLLPVVAQTAGMVGTFAEKLSLLPPGLTKIGTSAAVSAAAFLVLGGTLLKVGSTISGLATGLQNLAFLMQTSTLTVGAMALGATALVVALGEMYIESARAAQGIDALTNSTKIAQSAIDQFFLQTGQNYENATGQVRDMIDAAYQMKLVTGLLDTQLSQIAGEQTDIDLKHPLEAFDKAKGYLPFVESDVEHFAELEQEVADRHTQLTRIFQDPNVNTYRFGQELEKITGKFLASPKGEADLRQYLADVDELITSVGQYPAAVQTAEEAQLQFEDAVAKSVDTAHKDAEAKQVEAEAQARLNAEFLELSGLYRPFTRQAYDVQKATEEFNNSLEEQVRSAGLATSTLTDLEQQLIGTTRGFGNAGQSIMMMLIHANKLGQLKIPGADRRALLLTEDLNRANDALEKVDSTIDENNSKIGVWQDRIDFIDNTIGTNEDTLAEWTIALNKGRVTLDEFNEAVASGEAHEAYDKLNKLLRDGYINEDQYQDILHKGQYVRQQSEKEIEKLNAAQALLIPTLAESIAKQDQAEDRWNTLTDSQKATAAAIQDTNNQQALQLALMIKFLQAVGQISPEYATKLLLDLSEFDPTLRYLFEQYGFLEKPKKTKVEADTKPAEEDITEFDKKFAAGGGPVVHIPVHADTTPAEEELDEFDKKFAAGGGPPVHIGNRPAVQTPTIDTSPTTNSLDSVQGDAQQAGEDAASTFSNAVEIGIENDADDVAAAARAAVQATWVAQQDAFNSGFQAGYYYDLGILRGIESLREQIVQAAANAAAALDIGGRSPQGVDARSPSRKAMALARDWKAGILAELGDSRDIERSAARMLNRGFVAARPRLTVAGTRGEGFGSSATTTIVNNHTFDAKFSNHFNGITDAEQMMNAMRVEVIDSLSTWSAGRN